MKELVTQNQALILKELGFKDYVNDCIFIITGTRSWSNQEYRRSKVKVDILPFTRVSNSDKKVYVALPTVDEAIDWLRRKFDIVIYDAAAPFIDPTSNRGILYSYKVKACNPKWGWNMRESLGQTKWSPNHYAMKRRAITIALHWLIKKKCHDAGKQG